MVEELELVAKLLKVLRKKVYECFNIKEQSF